MSMNVTAAMQVKYKNNVEMQLQVQKCQLEDAVTTSDDTGEKVKVKDIVGNALPQEADERHGDTKYNNITFDGVWIPKPNELYHASLIDNADKLGTTIDLQGADVMAGAGVVNRSKTRRILEGVYNPIISGKDGTVSTPMPGSQIIPVTEGGAAGAQKMNVAKLIAANKLLAQGYVDPSMPKFMVLTADDNAQLLTEIPATSSDFKASYSGQVDAMGNLRSLLGWTFYHEELDNPFLGTIPALATDGSGYRKTPFWVKPGIVFNRWQAIRTSIDPIPGKLLSVQVFAGTTCAATRTQAGMSGVILNQKG